MPNFLYSLPADNVAALATLTCDDGTPEAMYPVANLVDLNPAKPCKLAETTGAFLWDFGSAQRVDLLAIIHHNLTAGLTVLIQANDTDDWAGSPGPALETTITIPAWWADGMPVNPLKDLTGVAGYTTGGYRFWRLAIGSIGSPDANASPIAVGDVLLLAEKRHFSANPLWGLGQTENRPAIEHLTDYEVATVYSYGVSRRRFDGQLILGSAALAELQDWYRATGGAGAPFLFALDGGAVNDCWLARFRNEPRVVAHHAPAQLVTTLAIDEVGRGLPL